MDLRIRLVAGAVLLALAPAVMAQTTTGTTPPPSKRPDASVSNTGQSRVSSRLATNFSALAGSTENAQALVNALRSGSAVTLVAAPAPGTTGKPVSTSIEVPTRPMGWGNVSHALSLAQSSLARSGITNPTNAQLQAALTGGDVVAADGSTVALKGILTMRADGMGWGRIAKATGTTMGAVVSSTRGMQPRGAAVTPTIAGAPAPKPPGGITTAADGAGGKATLARGITTAGAGAGSGHALGRGLVNASGGSVGTGAASLAAASGGQGAGLVSASGSSMASGAGVNTAAGPGNGHGNANGHGQGGGKGKGG